MTHTIEETALMVWDHMPQAAKLKTKKVFACHLYVAQWALDTGTTLSDDAHSKVVTELYEDWDMLREFETAT